MGPLRRLTAAALLGLLARAVPVAAAPADAVGPPAPAGPDAWRPDAAAFERDGRWDRAAELYLKLLASDRGRPEYRDRLVDCLRHLQQARRHRDPAHLARLQQLSFAKALALYADVLGKVGANYAEPDRSAPDRLFHTGLDEFCRALADDAFRQAHAPGRAGPDLRAYADRLAAARAGQALPDAAAARQAVRAVALDAQRDLGLDPAVAVMEFVCGACNGLDESSGFLPPGETDDAVTVADELTAAGLTLGLRGEWVGVDRVGPGGWADQAFVREGDRVTRLGRPVPDRAAPDAVAALLRAEATGPVRLDLASDGLLRSLEIPVNLPSTAATGMIDPDRGVGYTRLLTFRRSTLRDLDDAVLTLRMQGLRALVLDLRGNPGGLLSAAVQVAERFLPDGVVVSARGHAPGTTRTYTSRGGMAAVDVPLVLLVDGETASAAEVLAGAFKDNARAVVVGAATYGKGSVQGVVGVAGPGAVRLTLARLFSPRGLPLSGGVLPHVSEPAEKHQLATAVEAAARLAAMRP